MAAAFNPGYDVHAPCYRPRGAEVAQPILWPVLVYRVVAPAPRRRALNILERAVLGLCRAGLRRAEEIAPRLHLERDLAAYLLSDLLSRRLIDGGGAPTAQGEALWLGELEPETEMHLCHVFQEATGGALLPHLSRDLPLCTVRIEDGWPICERGTDGKPWIDRPFVYRPGASLPEPPTPEAILEASRRHQARLRRGGPGQGAPREEVPGGEAGEDEDDDPEGAEGLGGGDGEALFRVSFVEEEGRPLFLLTYLYVPEEREAPGWQVLDPFSRRPSPLLRERVHACAGGDRPGDRALGKWIDGLLDRSLEEQEAASERHAADLRARAARMVQEQLGAAVAASPLYDELCELWAARLRVARQGAEALLLDRRGVLLALRVLLERALSRLAQAAPLPEHLWRDLCLGSSSRRDEGFLGALVQRAAAQVGLRGVPPGLHHVPPEQVRAVCRPGRRGEAQHYRLRPLLLALLLHAARQEDHPLRQAALRAPDLLLQLDHLADTAGRGAHAGGAVPGARDLDAALKAATPALRALLDLG